MNNLKEVIKSRIENCGNSEIKGYYPDFLSGFEVNALSRASETGVKWTGENSEEIVELVKNEYRNVFKEIETPGFSWSIDCEPDGELLNIEVYLTHKNGMPQEMGEALWDAIGLGVRSYDKRSRCLGNTEVRFLTVYFNEYFG